METKCRCGLDAVVVDGEAAWCPSCAAGSFGRPRGAVAAVVAFLCTPIMVTLPGYGRELFCVVEDNVTGGLLVEGLAARVWERDGVELAPEASRVSR